MPSDSPLTAEEKRRRLAELLRKKAATPRTHPVSLQQRRLWFIDRLDPGSPAYNMILAVRLRGPLDLRVLERATEEVLRRHEALRTSFGVDDGEPVQLVGPVPALRLEVEEDLSHLDEEAADEAWRDPVRDFARIPFDLSAPPLFRTRLIRLGPDHHVLAVPMHHAIMDGWSQKLIVEEMSEVYNSFVRGEPSPLAQPSLQYGDFARWQRRQLSDDRVAREVAAWREALRDMPSLIELPTDRPRPAVQGHDGEVVQFYLDADVRAGLEAIGRQAGATDFMVSLAAFAVLARRLGAGERMVLGTPVAGRVRQELESVVGYFANTLAIPVDLSGDPTFRELLGRVRATTLEAYARQETPFEKLVEALDVERSLGHNPLYQLMFTYSLIVVEPEEEEGEGTVEFELTSPPARSAIVDFSATFHPDREEGRLAVQYQYRTDLFDEATVERWMDITDVLLTAIAEDPDRPISAYPLLDADGRDAALARATGPSAPYAPAPAHVLFAAQVEQTPDAPALVFGGESVSYADLDARANRLARHLSTLGVGRDVPVAISLPRSPEMVVALLAAMKAGGAYLPVDPTYPAERRRWMLEDSGAPVVLTLSTLVGDLPETEAKTVLLDQLDLSSVSSEAPSTDVSSDDLAYVIYTSGSTGRPKGVGVTHRGIGNLITAQGEAFGVEPGTRVLQFASFSFDAAVSEVLVTLLNGGVLHLATQDEMQPGEPLLSTLREGRIEVVTLPPSVLSVMPPEGLDDLRTIVSAGEACPADVVRTWSAGGRRFVNAYGPTETTVCVTMAVGLTAEDVEERRVPIGAPISNVVAHVLDARMQPLPVGVPGELYVGGPGVARGYLNRAELTAERFVPDPFSAETDDGEKPRLYRTGDRVRWTAEGTLEFLGRLDEQVKVRGFRIELGEIEAALRAQDGVADAVVLARTDLGAEPTLVGYVVPASGTSTDDVDADALRAALRRTLPEHMVPAAVVALGALPTTPNGKVDRRALPRPELAAGTEYVAPRTPTEEALAEIWGEVLGVDREKVGTKTDFFAAGGHSLAATQVVARIRQRFGVELPLRTTFEASALGALAACLDAELASRPAGDPAPRPAAIGRVARATRGGGLTLDDE